MAKHKEAVSRVLGFYRPIFDCLDVRVLKSIRMEWWLMGQRVSGLLEKASIRRVRTMRLVGKLLERGAALVKTEDLALVKEEYDYVTKIARARSPREKEAWSLRYKLAQDSLLRRRDNFYCPQN